MPRSPVIVLAVALGPLFGGAGCHHKVTKAECTQMLDHYLDMVIAGDPGTRNLPPAQATAVREMKRAI